MSGTKTPIATANMPLIEGIDMEIAAPPGGGWVTRFIRDGGTLTEDRSPGEPWIDPRAPGRLTKVLSEAVPTLSGKAIKAAIVSAFDDLKDSKDGQKLISESAARVIAATVSVTIELSEPPVTIVTLDNGGTLEFSSREMGRLWATDLNERWYSARRDLLQANRRDFITVAEHWLSIAEETEPLDVRSPWVVIAERLQKQIAPLPRSTDPVALKRYGVWQKPGGPLWVLPEVIYEVLQAGGFSPYDSRFARYLKQAGILIDGPKVIRHAPGPKGITRAWGFDPEFKDDTDAGPGILLSDDQEGTT